MTYRQSEEWLLSSGVRIDEYRNLCFRSADERIMTTIPIKAPALTYLSIRLAHWVSSNVERMLWLSNWETNPPVRLVLFETTRLGCGETRHVIDSPGHLFKESTEHEMAVLAGLMFLIMAFNWECYLTPRGQDEFLYLGDGHIVFSSKDVNKMKEVAELVSTFDLKFINDIREAWT